jgi:hypothetical protein
MPPITTSARHVGGPALRQALALAAARTLAWALLVSGWLVWGEIGRREVPHLAGGLAPLALWLACLGLSWRGFAGAGVSARRVPWVLLAAGAMAAGAWMALAQGHSTAIWIAVPASAALVTAASLAVRTLRCHRGAARPPAPCTAAALGAAVAWWAVGDPGTLAQRLAELGGATGAAAALLAVLAASAARAAAPGEAVRCSAGLFDCAMAWPARSQWRWVGDWPGLAAALAMLPMMASLPYLADWCSTAGLSPTITSGAHLAAMFAPGLVAARVAHRIALGVWRPLVIALLGAGAVLAVASPGVNGWMAAMALQSAAWGLAWSVPMMVAGASEGVGLTRPRGGVGASAVAVALAVLALGTLLQQSGPTAFVGVQVLLGAAALAGALLSGVVGRPEAAAALPPPQRIKETL